MNIVLNKTYFCVAIDLFGSIFGVRIIFSKKAFQWSYGFCSKRIIFYRGISLKNSPHKVNNAVYAP